MPYRMGVGAGAPLPMPIKLGSLPKPVGATVSLQQDSQLQRRLQQDSIELAGKTVYLNPFLYCVVLMPIQIAG